MNKYYGQEEVEALLPIVAELSEAYTCKESSSISYDKARQLMGAVLYCMQGRPENHMIVQNSSLEQIRKAYRSGYRLIVERVKFAGERYNLLTNNFNAYGNHCYEATVMNALPGFFLHYDPQFDPTNTVITMDYPILVSIHKYRGIDAIEKYLDAIELEQHFLSCLPEDVVREALFRYHQKYEDLFINIASVTLRELLSCQYMKKAFSDGHTPEGLIKAQTKEQLQQELSNLLHELMEALDLKDQKLEAYLAKDLKDFSVRLKHKM